MVDYKTKEGITWNSKSYILKNIHSSPPTIQKYIILYYIFVKRRNIEFYIFFNFFCNFLFLTPWWWWWWWWCGDGCMVVRFAVSVRWEREMEERRRNPSKKSRCTCSTEDLHTNCCCCAHRIGNMFSLLETPNGSPIIIAGPCWPFCLFITFPLIAVISGLVAYFVVLNKDNGLVRFRIRMETFYFFKTFFFFWIDIFFPFDCHIAFVVRLYILSYDWYYDSIVILCQLPRSRSIGTSDRWRGGPGWLVLEWTSWKLSSTGSIVLPRMQGNSTNSIVCSYSLYGCNFDTFCVCCLGFDSRLWSSLSMDWYRYWKKEYVLFQIICDQCEYFMLYEYWTRCLWIIEKHLIHIHIYAHIYMHLLIQSIPPMVDVKEKRRREFYRFVTGTDILKMSCVPKKSRHFI